MSKKRGGKKPRGPRAKTRNLKQKTKITVNKLLAEFNIGDKVQINIQPSIHSGLLVRQFNGLTGKVVAKQGKALMVEVLQGNMPKKCITEPVHLRALNKFWG